MRGATRHWPAWVIELTWYVDRDLKTKEEEREIGLERLFFWSLCRYQLTYVLQLKNVVQVVKHLHGHVEARIKEEGVFNKLFPSTRHK